MKKYIFGATLLLAVCVSPVLAQAQTGLTTIQINSIIQLLQSFGANSATIANVNKALGGQPTTGGSLFCYNFNNDLTVGSRGADITALNQALLSSGVDTTGNTSNFTEDNAGDVVSFQAKYGIRQTGYVGPLTRTKLNELYGCNNQQPAPPVTVTPVVHPTPTISSVTPASVTAGGTITIYGSSFDSGSYLKVDGNMSILPSSIASTMLTFVIPSGMTVGSHTISIGEKASDEASNAIALTVVGTSPNVPTITTDPIPNSTAQAYTLPFCAQPPMPTCPTGMACAQGMPSPKTYTSNDTFNSDKATYLYEGACISKITECSNGATNPPSCTTTPAAPTITTTPILFCGQPPMPAICQVAMMSMVVINIGCQSLPPPKTYTSYDTFNSDKATYLYAGSCKTPTTSFVSGTNNTASALNAFNSAEGSVTNSSSVPSFNYIWNNDLQIGSQYFADVTALQTALTKEGLYSGEITGGFYSQTFAAVQAFQHKYGIEATGFVGSITRAKLNVLY